MYLRITLSALKLSVNDFNLILFLLAIVQRNSCNIALSYIFISKVKHLRLRAESKVQFWFCHL